MTSERSCRFPATLGAGMESPLPIYEFDQDHGPDTSVLQCAFKLEKRGRSLTGEENVSFQNFSWGIIVVNFQMLNSPQKIPRSPCCSVSKDDELSDSTSVTKT